MPGTVINNCLLLENPSSGDRRRLSPKGASRRRSHYLRVHALMSHHPVRLPSSLRSQFGTSNVPSLVMSKEEVFDEYKKPVLSGRAEEKEERFALEPSPVLRPASPCQGEAEEEHTPSPVLSPVFLSVPSLLSGQSVPSFSGFIDISGSPFRNWRDCPA